MSVKPAFFCVPRLRSVGVLVLGAAVAVPLARGSGPELEQPPINYSKGTPDNVISRLQAKLDAGKMRLQFHEDHGYLPSVLKALDVPLSSQVLVFSKTSLQRHRISPKTPRALYFNDDVYLGFCWRGDVLEVSAVDAGLGTVFYTLDQIAEGKPRFVRQTDSCMTCHSSSLTRGCPGHFVRSLFTDRQGQPILSLGSIRVDQSTEFAQRWGGWYVTGTSGKQSHRGNQILTGRASRPPAENPDGVNVTELRTRFTVADYPTPHSDLVALMVLEHQGEMHNRITRASFETRLALHQQAEFDRLLKRKSDGLSDSTASRIRSGCEPLVQYLFFSGEAKLTGKIAGTSGFAEAFAARGPKDGQGRSLRQFDLERRLFRYPCSYLIYSEAFDKLPVEAKEYVYRRIWEVLTERDTSHVFAHLARADREAIRDILLATKPDLRAYWERP
ncbi:MAG: hypothetical protein IT429_10855 [Gemmataceae bacterium]|nr:hypothetical protein [Gemmataceae bacterium]